MESYKGPKTEKEAKQAIKSSYILKESYERFQDIINRLIEAKNKHNSSIPASKLIQPSKRNYELVDVTKEVNMKVPYRHMYAFDALVDQSNYWHAIYFSDLGCAGIFQTMPLINGFYYKNDEEHIYIHESLVCHCGSRISIDSVELQSNGTVKFTYSLHCVHCGLDIQTFSDEFEFKQVLTQEEFECVNEALKQMYNPSKYIVSTELYPDDIKPQIVRNCNNHINYYTTKSYVSCNSINAEDVDKDKSCIRYSINLIYDNNDSIWDPCDPDNDEFYSKYHIHCSLFDYLKDEEILTTIAGALNKLHGIDLTNKDVEVQRVSNKLTNVGINVDTINHPIKDELELDDESIYDNLLDADEIEPDCLV